MRFSDADTAYDAVRKAVELGVNYFDVAPYYGNGTAEPWLSAGLKGLRDKVIVTAKSTPGDGGKGIGEYSMEKGFGIRTADQARRQIERSLKLLGVDYFDVYQLWTCNSDLILKEALKPGGFIEGVVKAQSEGLLGHIGITGHGDSDFVIRALKSFDFALIITPFDLLDTSRAKAVKYCAEHDVGVLAMNPLGGGKLASGISSFQRIADDLGFPSMKEAALRCLVGYPGVTSALSGMTYADQVVENVEAVEKGGVGSEVMAEFDLRLKELLREVEHFCAACGYCGECPEGILIPEVIDIYNGLLVPSMADSVRHELNEKRATNLKGYDPSLCVACKSCEAQCPRNLPISDIMSKAARKW